MIHDLKLKNDEIAEQLKKCDDKANIQYRLKTSKGDYVLNPNTNKMIKKRSRTYNQLFLGRKRGQPRKDQQLANGDTHLFLAARKAYFNPNSGKVSLNYRSKK